MRRAAKEICRRVGEDGSAVAQVARDFGVGLCHGLRPAPRGAPLLGPRPHRGDLGGRDRRAQGAGGDQGPRCLLRHELRRLGAGQERRRRGLTGSPSARLSGASGSRRSPSTPTPATWSHLGRRPRRHRDRGPLPGDTPRQLGGRRRLSTNAALHARPAQTARRPAHRTRRLMTRGWEHLSARQREKLFGALSEGDPDGEVGQPSWARSCFARCMRRRTSSKPAGDSCTSASTWPRPRLPSYPPRDDRLRLEARDL